MDSIIRSAVLYLLLLVVFRISGQRSLGQTTTFEFVLLLIIGESTQQALLGDDLSITNAILIVVTLVTMDIVLSMWKQRSRLVENLIEGVPLVIVENGTLITEHMAKANVDEADVLAAARISQGLEKLSQIKYAVLERSGEISIIPEKQGS